MYIQIEVKPVKCQNCAYQWYYKGKNGYVAHCPHCRHYVNIQKQTMVNDINENLEEARIEPSTSPKSSKG